MTSGFWITWFVPTFLLIFGIWELVQLYRRRRGNKSARTMSQYVVWKAKGGSAFYEGFIWIFPIVLGLLLFFLLFHWEAPCISFGLLCDLTEGL